MKGKRILYAVSIMLFLFVSCGAGPIMQCANSITGDATNYASNQNDENDMCCGFGIGLIAAIALFGVGFSIARGMGGGM